MQLSGGQKQRIALARALVWEPKILVLDDPLSAVDAKTEAAILDAIERQAAKRTVVLITHRVAAAARCDRSSCSTKGRSSSAARTTSSSRPAGSTRRSPRSRRWRASSKTIDRRSTAVARRPSRRASPAERRASSAARQPSSARRGHSEPRASEKLRAFHEEDALGKAYDTRLLRRLWPFVKPHAQFVVLSLATLVVMAGAQPRAAALDGRRRRQAQARRRRTASCATASCSRCCSSSCSR